MMIKFATFAGLYFYVEARSVDRWLRLFAAAVIAAADRDRHRPGADGAIDRDHRDVAADGRGEQQPLHDAADAVAWTSVSTAVLPWEIRRAVVPGGRRTLRRAMRAVLGLVAAICCRPAGSAAACCSSSRPIYLLLASRRQCAAVEPGAEAARLPRLPLAVPLDFRGVHAGRGSSELHSGCTSSKRWPTGDRGSSFCRFVAIMAIGTMVTLVRSAPCLHLADPMDFA